MRYVTRHVHADNSSYEIYKCAHQDTCPKRKTLVFPKRRGPRIRKTMMG